MMPTEAPYCAKSETAPRKVRRPLGRTLCRSRPHGHSILLCIVGSALLRIRGAVCGHRRSTHHSTLNGLAITDVDDRPLECRGDLYSACTAQTVWSSLWQSR